MTDPAAAPDGDTPERDRYAASGRPLRIWPHRSIVRSIVGRAGEPAWSRPALLVILLAAAVLYCSRLSRNGNANVYYSAAALSATRSWHAFFFGSLDSGNFITVDKPPLALWVQALSARAFGFGAWSVLLPQAVAGVVATAVLWHTVRLTAGHAAALATGVVIVLTPINVAINRDNNPDPLLVLCLIAAACAVTYALGSGRWTPLLGAGAFIGLGFNTKLLQAWIVLPALAATYLIAGPPRLRTRLLQLAAAGGVTAAVSSLWIVIVDLIPPTDRPYVGGSSDGTALDLVLGYNGLQRLFGTDRPASGQGGPAGIDLMGGMTFGGNPGWERLFNLQVGSQIGWLLPLAMLLLAAGLLARRHAPRTDPLRSALLLWGGWLLITGVVFSLAGGTFHPYYTTALTPAIAGLIGVGGGIITAELRRGTWLGWALPIGVAGSVAWAAVLVRRYPGYHSWLTVTVVTVGVVAVVLLAAIPRFPGAARARRGRLRGAATLAVTASALVLAPGTYAVSTAAAVQQGPNPTAGPSAPTFTMASNPQAAGIHSEGTGRGDRALDPSPPGELLHGQPPPSLSGAEPGTEVGETTAGLNGAPPGDSATPATTGRADVVDLSLISYLRRHRGNSRWLVATGNANAASLIILATGGEPVMAAGGFLGTDPVLTDADLRRYVGSGQLRYVLTSPIDAIDGSVSVLSAWTAAHCRKVDPAEYAAGVTVRPSIVGAQTLNNCAP
ncbi:glycosyltransferase family 39 protein [Actinoplanes sp. CA-030573]|uniref:glycosyltransferase family 39 protein n=1 Tax=Actinoplanes sp. CA-030573 TaxID=3239898 RepID=UPI003D8B0D89